MVLFVKTIPEYTSDKVKCICSEFTISKSKWTCFSIYWPPVSSNLTIFFEELTKVLSKAVLKHENIILMGDFNIAFKSWIWQIKWNVWYFQFDELDKIRNLLC